MTYFIGVDIAKHDHVASIIDQCGVVHVHPFSFKNTIDGFQLFLSKFSSFDKEEVVIGFESTAHYHQNLYHFLSINDYHSILLNPILTKRFRGLNIRDIKTDKIDSLSICSYLAFSNSKSSSFKINDLMYLCKHREDLKRKVSNEKIKLTSMLDRTFPELKEFIGSSLYTQGFLNLLKTHNTAQIIKTTRKDKLFNTLNEHRQFISVEKVSLLKVLASSSVGFHSESLSLSISDCVYQIELFSSQLKRVDKRIVLSMQELDSPLLKIPGLGYIQSAYILASIVNISQFDSPSKLLAFAGLDPKIRQSGMFEAKSCRMSKRGNKLLRYALIWSAHNVVRNSTTMNDYYLKKRSEGKSHYNALGHCAKKLTNYIFFVLKNPDKEFILN